MLALLGYGMVITFMVLIMSKKMTAFTALITVPVIFGLLGGFGGIELGEFALTGVKSVSSTAAMLLFAILFFGIMISAGVFDPLVNATLKFVKGDPLKVLVGTAILAAIVSLDGDGSTTTMICCSALIPVYKKLDIKMMYLAAILIMQNSILNLIPWGGPTARVMAVLNLDGGTIFRPLIPGMILAVIYVIGVAYYLGLKERKRLGIKNTEIAVDEIAASLTAEEVALKRPKLIIINFILTVVVVATLIKGNVPAAIIFEVGTAIALLINYPKLKTQREIIETNAGAAMQVLIMVLAAGVFMGILTETKMAEAIAQNLVALVPDSMGKHFGLITAIISVPGTFFLSNDAFYFGVLPVLAETGAQFGFTSLQIGVASLLGQAFHLLSPLVAFIYLLLQLTGVDMGEWQRYVAKWAIGIFVIFVVAAIVVGIIPL